MNRQRRRDEQRRGSGEPASEFVVPEEGPDDDLGDEAVDDGRTGGASLGGYRPSGGTRVAAAPAPTRHAIAPRQFLHEVNVELRKVAWPTRAETINYSTVVLVTLALVMALIFGLDLGFTKVAGFLFNP